MADAKKIEQIWQRVYSMTQSHSAAKTLGSFLSLPPHFDQDLLNDIAQLKTVSIEGQASLIEKIRGQLQIAGVTGLVGNNDLEELHKLLDSIEKEG